MTQAAPLTGIARLSQRLRRIAPEQAALRARLFGSGDALADGGCLLWRFAPAPGMLQPALALSAGEAAFSISLVQDGLRQPLGEREWWDYSGDSRLLAWTLAHGELLDGLGRLLGAVPLAQRWQEEKPAAEQRLLLAFSVTAEGRGAAGILDLPPALAEALAAHPGWRRALPGPGWQALPARLRIELAGFAFPLRELRDSAAGDVLVLGPRAQAWRRLRLLAADGGRHWPALYDGERSCRIAPPVSFEQPELEPSMSDQAQAAAAANSPLEGVPVVLDFELGALQLSVAELAALQPGYVFQLGGRLEEARVIVRANGVRIGHGELVAVGEVLGVQLTAIDPHGFR